eukprot:COSAG02_NODE_5450_length_4310_cov_2.774638_5_plen_258_part_00
MEKAYAKLVRSYYATSEGECSDALNYLTGGVVSRVTSESPEEAWTALKSTIAAGAFASTSCKSSIDAETLQSVGLLHGHAYSLLQTFEQKKSRLRLVQVKNPWGSFEWSGDYSDDSPLWTKKLKQEVNRAVQKRAKQISSGSGDTSPRAATATAVKDDGAFWMSWTDFTKYFEDVSMCNPWIHGKTRYSVSSSWQAGVSAGGPVGFATFDCNPSFALEISNATEGDTEQKKVNATFSLTQSDIRGDDSREQFDLLCE